LGAVIGGVLLASPALADTPFSAFRAEAARIAMAGPALRPAAFAAAGRVQQLADGRAWLAMGPVEAQLTVMDGPGDRLRLTVTAHGRIEIDVRLRGTAVVAGLVAQVQIADIDRENAEPDVLVALMRGEGVRLIVATAKSDGPGWEISPSVLALPSLEAATARDLGGDGLAELVVADPKVAALLPADLPAPLAVLAMRATAWLDLSAQPMAAPLHRAVLTDLLTAPTETEPLIERIMAVGAQLGALDGLWQAARRHDLGGRGMRERIVMRLGAAGYIPAELSLDARRPGDRSR
jgi:hypothetical protein